MKSRIDYNLKVQEKNNYCVCSVLQAIFERNGFKISQDKIAKNLEPSKNGFYVDDKKFKNFIELKGFNYKYYFHNQTPFNEPDMLLKEDIDIFMGWDNHVFLVKQFEDPIAHYINPKNGNDSSKELKEILKLMSWSKDGFFGLIKKI